MKKIFLSADIEGTCGIAHWDEARIGAPGYDAFAAQMTREVAAACQGAVAGGAQELLVKDAHGSARNIDAHALPRCTRIFRGWARDPYVMMAGLDASFDGVFFTGYHNAAGTDGNPLAHTMNGGCVLLSINGETASELHVNCLTAAMLGVPVLMVTGDASLCAWVNRVNPNIRTVAVNQGIGDGTLAIHPDEAVERIQRTACEAMAADPAACRFPLPDHFHVEITYREHPNAHRNSFYPGAQKAGPRTVAYDAADYADVLRFLLFCL